MYWTPWKSPLSVVEFEPDDISYQELDTHKLISTDPINGICTGFSRLRTKGIHALLFENWGVLEPIGITHLEFRIHISRLARVKDLTIQLCKNGELIGKNMADLMAEDTHIYGGPIAEWGLEEKEWTAYDLSDIGLVVDYQPHPTMPSSELVYLRKIQMRVSYLPHIIGDIICPHSKINIQLERQSNVNGIIKADPCTITNNP